MKRVLFALLLTGAVFAVEIPQPVRGSAMMIGGKQFTSVAGDTAFVFTFPQGWGIGNMSAGKEGGSFDLMPAQTGYGAQVWTTLFGDAAQANERLSKIKATLSGTQELTGGFEIKFPKAWYSVQVQDQALIEIWYSLPKIKPENEQIWNQLKTCIAVKKEEKNSQAFKSPFEEVFDAPNKKLHVMIKTHGAGKKLNEDPKLSHLLKFNDPSVSAFFFIKWNQQKLDVKEPFTAHLKEMQAEISAMVKEQKFASNDTYDLKDGWAFRQGNPYSLITLSGDGFLFGFAYQGKTSVFDINNYIRRVEWWTDKD
jgi:hypothetical protein